ncbi:MAG: Ig-like domain-containing protein [Isosphaeraceae bacterium]
MTILTLPRHKVRCSPGFDTLEARSLLSIGLPGDGVLDITFIGDKYTDMGQFHSDVQRVANALLSYEPFKSRADQIRTNDVDNTVSLGSQRDPSMSRLLYVDDRIATSIVEASGVPTDVIGVLVNDPLYGGAGGSEAVSYNGSQMGDVFVHEFGHTFGRLFDEYPYGTTAALDNKLHDLDSWKDEGNVYAGTPPAAAWSSLVAPDEYFLGAGLDNWYRTSLHSVMSGLGGTVFNAVSQLQIESKIDYWAGPSSDHQAPTVTVTGLHNGDSVAGVVPVSTSLTDNRSVIIAQLWVDGQLARTSWEAPFTLDWTTGHTTPGVHTLVVKALDASGNIGVSAPVQVNLTAGADIQIVSPASNSQLTGTVLPLKLALWPEGVDHVSVQLDGAEVSWFNPSYMGTETTVYLASPLNAGSHTLTAVASVSNPDPAHLLERYRTSITLTSTYNAFGITFRSPQSGATVKGVVGLAVNATSGQPRVVRYYADGALIGTSTKAPFAVNWNTRKVKDGTHMLTAVASNSAGSTAQANIQILIKNFVDRKKPVVSISKPRNNTKFRSGLIVIAGRASDNVALANVTLFIDNKLVSVLPNGIFTWSQDVTSLSKGKHKIRIRALDTSGNVGWSSILTVQRT